MEDCRRLLAKLLEWLDPSFASTLNTPKLTATSWLIGAVLYRWLAVRRGRTIGMEASGLRLKTGHHPQITGSWWTSTIASLAVAGASVVYYHKTRGIQSTSNSEQESARAPTMALANGSLLRGNPRRQAFARQRQEMIARATHHRYQQEERQEHSPSDMFTEDTNGLVYDPLGPIHSEKTPSLESIVGPLGAPWVDRLKQWSVATLHSIVNALSSCSAGGPHDLPENANTLIQDNGIVHSSPILASVGYWLIRLQIAYHCLGGQFYWPMWTFLRRGTADTSTRKLTQDGGRHAVSDERLHNPPQPQSVRILGFLILSHAVKEGLRYLTRSYIHFSVRKSLHSKTTRLSGSENDKQVPLFSSPSSSVDPKRRHENSKRQPVSCSICQEPRTFPACSVHCGHIFCWSCLQQWVASKMECPVCRTSCRPQDILLLENYNGPLSSQSQT